MVQSEGGSLKLWEYVQANAVRGACTCGKCIDAPPSPEDKQPPDSVAHTVNMTFFKVARKESGDATEFVKLVEAEFPHWLDGKEHSYLECGADIGDQGLALTAMGLGHVLGVWKVLGPDTIPSIMDMPDDLKKLMAGSGYITIQSTGFDKK